MAATANTALSAFSLCGPVSSSSSSSFTNPICLPAQFFRFRKPNATITCLSSPGTSSVLEKRMRTEKLRSLVAAAGEQSLVSDGDEASATAPPPPPTVTDQTVSVTVSPSDVLTMFFQAEGTINETAIPTVTKALEETEGITNLRVQVLEGIASVELTKQTTVQATGVASNLVEVIQSKGFKLQTLNLSFQDEEDFS